MKKCNSCGKYVESGKNFCKYCGAPLKEQSKGLLFGKKTKETEKHQYVCMYCRTVHKTFSCVCPDCGKEQIGAVQSKSVLELRRQLHEIDYPSSKKPSVFSKRKNKPGYQQNPDVQKANLIKNYIIPDAKEDILDFMAYAVKQIDVGILMADSEKDLGLDKTEYYKQRSLSAAWYEKLGKAYGHALELYGNDNDFYVIRNLYNNIDSKIQQIAASKRQKRNAYTYRSRPAKKRFEPVKGIVALAIAAVLFGVIGEALSESGSRNFSSTDNQIEAQVQENDVLTENSDISLNSNETLVVAPEGKDEFAEIKENVISRPIVEGRDYLVGAGVVVKYLNNKTFEEINSEVFNQKDETLSEAGWIIDDIDEFDPSDRTMICYVDCKGNNELIADNSSEAEIDSSVETLTEYTFEDIDGVKYAKTQANVRSSPDMSGNTLGQLKQNDMVVVTGICKETQWFRIEYDNGTGYVKNSLLVDHMIESQPVAVVETVPEITETYTDTSSSDTQSTNNESVSIASNNSSEVAAPAGVTYILNTNPKSRKFHKPSCGSAQKIKSQNRMDVDWSREKCIEEGYTPCGNCDP